MIATVVATVLATLSLCFGMAGGWFFYSQRQKRPADEVRTGRAEIIEGRLGALEGALAAMKITVEGFPSLWEDERERTKKHADRGVAALKGAEEILEALSEAGEDPDEDGELPFIDGDGSGLMRPLYGDVAGSGARAEAETALRDRARRHLEAMG